jgi:hypothetical protein
MGILETIKKGAEPPVWGSRPGNTSNRSLLGWLPGAAFDYEAEAGKLWLNGVVMMGLRFKACAISEMRPTVQELGSDGQWNDAAPSPKVKDLLRAFSEPTEDYDWSVLLGSVQLSDDVKGNAYLVKRRSRAGVIGFRYEPHTLFEAATDDSKRLVTHYLYGPPGDTRKPVEREDVVHFRMPFLNPDERRLGLTPLVGVLRSVCADNEIDNWLAAVLRNGAVASHMLIPKAEADSTEWANNRDSILSLFKKFVRDARGETMTAPMPMEAVKMMWSPAELQLAELQMGPAARILGAMGLNSMCVGLPDPNKTYSNFEVAMDAAGKMTILPATRRWMGQFSKQVLPDFGLDPQKYRLWLDDAGVSWLQDETNDVHERHRKNFEAGAFDQYRFQELLGETPDPKGKGVYYVDLQARKAPAMPEGKPGEKPKEEAKGVVERMREAKARVQGL